MEQHKTETVTVDSLTPHPRNYRGHPEDQLAHIKRSIEENGVYRNVVISREGVILAGHGVVQAARELGIAEIPVVRLDVAADDIRALKVLAGDNYISHLSDDDDRLLTEVLKEIRDADSLDGTGFDDRMLASLVMVTRHQSEIADFDAAAEWVGAGMPEFDPGKPSIRASVEFLTEEDRDAFLKTLGVGEDHITRRDGGALTSFWWPPRPRNDLESVKVTAGGDGA